MLKTIFKILQFAVGVKLESSNLCLQPDESKWHNTMWKLVVEEGVKKYSMKYSYIQANMSLTGLWNEREWSVCTLIWNTMFILIMMSKGPIKLTMLQGPFGAINPSQIQQLMQQVGDKNVMFFFWAKRVFVKIQTMKTFSEQNATNLASGDGGRKGLEQLIPQLQVFVCLMCLFCDWRFCFRIYFSSVKGIKKSLWNVSISIACMHENYWSYFLIFWKFLNQQTNNPQV